MITGTRQKSLEGHTDRVISLAVAKPYSFDENVFVREEKDETNLSRKAKSKKQLVKTLVASGSRDEILNIWDLENRTCLHSIHAHKSPIWSVAITVLRDGTVIALTTANDGTMKTWNGLTAKKLNTLKGHTDKVLTTFILEGKKNTPPLLFTGGVDKSIRVWDLIRGKHLKLLDGHNQQVNSIIAGTFSDMASLVPIIPSASLSANAGGAPSSGSSGSSRLTAKNLNNASKSKFGGNDNESDSDDTGEDSVDEDGGGLSLKDGNGAIELAKVTLISASSDMTLRIWDVNTGYLLFELVGHSAIVYDLTMVKVPARYAKSIRAHNDGQVGLLATGAYIILSCSDDSTIKVWSLAAGALIKTLHWHNVSVRGLDSGLLTKNNKMSAVGVASFAWDKTVQFHDFQDAIIATNESCCTIS